ncbi:MAG: bile acid:sodium symporter family protein [Syntrophales bacterium]
MFRLKDFVLLLVIFATMLAGIVFARASAVFQPYPMYCLMLLFFLSYIPIRIEDIVKTVRTSWAAISWVTFIKLLVLPAAVYLLFRGISPEYAVSALLLTGVSTGVTAPFIAGLVGANTPIVLVFAVVTSVLVPFTLPFLIEVLLSRTTEISISAMFRLLAFVIFVPMIVAEVLRKITSSSLDRVMKKQYPLSLILFAVINLGVFSKYADFFRQDPAVILQAVFVSVILSFIYFAAGILLFLRRPVQDQTAGAVIFGNMNNVLVIVFSSHFFGALEPTVAALYLIPYFGLIFVLRAYGAIKNSL